MLAKVSPLRALKQALASGETTPVSVAEECARRANGSASRNTYLYLDAERMLADAAGRDVNAPLFGVPVSLKDCFDLAGTVTTCGSKFYAERTPPATRDSTIAARLRACGALITGKTHLHPLAYGITGQNPEYGDCLQPRDAALLTGGSSSGAAASVQEGSALAAIGTDTGGSIRVPAVLCGLTGYRASHELGARLGMWEGGAHLAESFDTIGFLLRDPRDAAPIANALFDVPLVEMERMPRIGVVADAFVADGDDDVRDGFAMIADRLRGWGAHVEEFGVERWGEAREILAGIQAHEAAALHRGHYEEFEATIAQRLAWGASLSDAEIVALRERHAAFQAAMDDLFTRFDLLMLPCAPMSRLVAAEDHSATRVRIIRYTAPFSLAGVPVIALPGEMFGAGFGTGVQIAAAPGQDAGLLAFSAALAELA